ncbi:MAG: TetR/AcrR family transcriptional regulator [Polaribacter sp.]|nr:TetR/AcrR family transcriptional regulator [Polaribacter sp.]MDG1812002.1 TetR/AcrR family transcriptional regulator [Polaribacter sp.]MDG1994590.1 TetR/AcrR family transcriptional regulator [Polaribacter sp.]
MSAKDQNTEKKILNAAESIFQRKGMDGARMQEIADEAGINKAMLHYYYKSKQLLFGAVFIKAFSLLAPQLNAILNDDSTIEIKIRNFANNYISFISKHPYIPSFIIMELNKNPDFVLKIKSNPNFPNLKKFNKQVEKEVENKILKPINSQQLFMNIISMCIFPFVASPLVKALLDVNDKDYQLLMEARKIEIANFIIDAIKI